MNRRIIRAEQLRLDQHIAHIDGCGLAPKYGRWPWVTAINTGKQPGKVFVALSCSPWSALLDPGDKVTVIDEEE